MNTEVQQIISELQNTGYAENIREIARIDPRLAWALLAKGAINRSPFDAPYSMHVRFAHEDEDEDEKDTPFDPSAAFWSSEARTPPRELVPIPHRNDQEAP